MDGVGDGLARCRRWFRGPRDVDIVGDVADGIGADAEPVVSTGGGGWHGSSPEEVGGSEARVVDAGVAENK